MNLSGKLKASSRYKPCYTTVKTQGKVTTKTSRQHREMLQRASRENKNAEIRIYQVK